MSEKASNQNQQRQPYYKNHFSERIPFPTSGSPNASDIYCAVGECLSYWEYTETSFAELYGQIIRPTLGSYASRRAYGSIESSRARSTAMKQAAGVFFQFFPDPEAELRFLDLFKLYQDGGARRNEIAHGMVMNGVNHLDGYFLTANPWGSKSRRRDMNPAYIYDVIQLHQFRDWFVELSQHADQVHFLIEQIFHASPQTRRERY